MSGCQDQYGSICKREFGEIHQKLDHLDEAIRGNGKPGIQLRLDRLEQSERTRGRLLWLLLASAVTLAAASLWQKVFG